MKQTYLYGAMAVGLLFASCSSSDPIPNEDKILDNNQAYFVSVRISGDVPDTRAGVDDGTPTGTDFGNGSGNESTVSNVYFVFYDNDGNVIGDVTPVDDMKSDGWKTDVSTDAIEKYYKSVVKVNVMKGEKQPTQVICYINPVNPGNLNVPLRDIQTLQLETAVKGSGETLLFPMSNSVYYPYDDNTTTVNPNATPIIAVPLVMNVNLFTKEGDAEAANEKGECAEIYVERYASKLAFDASSATQEDFVTGQRVWNTDGTEKADRNKITLHFNPQYWAVNAESKKTYVIKSFRQNANDGAILPDNYTFKALNDIINEDLSDVANRWNWNAPNFNRSYWGMSPAYYTNSYPEVSSDLDPNHSEPQKYISYNELKNGVKGYKADNNTAQYFKETTVGKTGLGTKNPAAAVASVIYVGKYTVKLNNVDLPEDTGFYTYLSGPVPGADETMDDQPYIYFENQENSVNSAVAGGESMLKRFLIQCSALYKKDTNNNFVQYEIGNGSGFNDLAAVLDVSELTIDEKKNYNPATENPIKLQHNARTLRFKDKETTEDKNIYILTYDGYKQVVGTVTDPTTQISKQDANIALARNVGYALYYTSGHAYFNIPVKHFGWYRKGNENTDNSDINWNKVRVGDFGMVRNHSYSIIVDHIKGLASGIGGDNVEIVPPSFSQDYFMSYRVNILKWAVVPEQEVKL